jgi:hypothetical protein
MPSPDQILDTLLTFLRARTWGESRRTLNAHPELLNVGTGMIDMMLKDPITVTMVYPDRSRSEAEAALRKHKAVLARCREVGIARAFAELGEQRSRSGRRGLSIMLFVAGLVAATVVGILIYNHSAKPAVKIPEALIPQITHVSTYQNGLLVYVRVQYSDPGHYAEGFGFVGANGSGWAEENNSFADPSYGIPGPGRIDYPFNLGCGTSSEDTSDVQFWINDTAGDRSNPVIIHLACKD